MNFLLLTLQIVISWTAVHCSALREKMFFLQNVSGGDNATLLVVTWSDSDGETEEGCEVFRDEELINEVLKSTDGKSIHKFSEDETKILLEECVEFSLRRKRKKRQTVDVLSNERRSGWLFRRNNPATEEAETTVVTRNAWLFRRNNPTTQAPEKNGDSSNPNVRTSRHNHRRRKDKDNLNDSIGNRGTTPMSTLQEETTTEVPATTEGYSGWPVIWLGTKWCGAGDIAEGYEDLGHHADTDKCCRAHDLCNDTLAPGHTKNNLTNDSLFTKLHCKCDHDFYDCLSNVNSVTANAIGNLFFNVLSRDCYDFDHPPTSQCRSYRSFFKIKCEEYEKNSTAPKVFQWVPAKKYKAVPVPGPLSVTLPI